MTAIAIFTLTARASRACAAYGGIYIVASLARFWAVDGKILDRWDARGGVICALGALVVLCGPRTA